jgi:hypothetical protein
MTRTEALEVVIDAALNWQNELLEYIAPASEQFDDEESAEAQRDDADMIDEAIKVLRKEGQ